MWRFGLFTIVLISPALSEVAVILGGAVNTILNPTTASVETYSNNCGIYPSPLPPLPEPRQEFDAAVLDDVIYACGGYHLLSADSTCVALDLLEGNRTWRPIASMNNGRYKLKLLALDGKLYAVGGEGAFFTHNDMEIYDPDSDTWTPGPSLTGFREGHCAVAIEEPVPAIYVMGGYDQTGGRKRLEQFDFESNEWIRLADMNENRTSLSCLPYRNGFVALGGWSGSGQQIGDIYPIRYAEYFDIETNTWTVMQEMRHPRTEFGAALVGGNITVFGGRDGGELDTYEVFSPASNGLEGEWNYGAERMEEGKSNMAVVRLEEGVINEC